MPHDLRFIDFDWSSSPNNINEYDKAKICTVSLLDIEKDAVDLNHLSFSKRDSFIGGNIRIKLKTDEGIYYVNYFGKVVKVL